MKNQVKLEELEDLVQLERQVNEEAFELLKKLGVKASQLFMGIF